MHTGHDLGFPASGCAAQLRGMTWMRLEDGRLKEGWDVWNQGALLE